MNWNVQAATIDEVNKADVDRLQLLIKPVSNTTARPTLASTTYLLALSN